MSDLFQTRQSLSKDYSETQSFRHTNVPFRLLKLGQRFIPNYELRTKTDRGHAGHTGAHAGQHSTVRDTARYQTKQIYTASFLALSVDCSRLHPVFPRTLSISTVLLFSMWPMDPRGCSYNTKDTIFLCVSDDVA